MSKNKYLMQRLDAIAKLSSGTTPSRDRQNDFFDDGVTPWVKTGDLNNSIVYKTEELLTPKALAECNVRVYPRSTVLVAMYGGFRQIGRTGLLGVDAAINQALCALQINTKIGYAPFVQAALNDRVGAWRRLAASSRKDPNITGNDVGFFRIPVPPIPIQVAIAKVATEFDSKLRCIAKGLGALRKRKLRLTQNLLLGKQRFTKFVISKNRSQATRFEFPDDWTLVNIESIADEVSNTDINHSTATVLSSTKYDGLVDSLEYFGRRVYSDDTSNYKLVKKGQFAYATNHIEEGSIGLLMHRDAGLVSPMYTVFEVTGDAVPEYLFPLFKSDRYLHLFRAMTNGSVNRRGGLRWIDFKTIKVALPSKAEQLQIIELLTLIDHEIVLLKKLKQATEKQKRGVMERLLTGEVTIPDHVIERLNAEMEQDERKRIKAETRAKSKATGNYQ